MRMPHLAQKDSVGSVFTSKSPCWSRRSKEGYENRRYESSYWIPHFCGMTGEMRAVA